MTDTPSTSKAATDPAAVVTTDNPLAETLAVLSPPATRAVSRRSSPELSESLAERRHLRTERHRLSEDRLALEHAQLELEQRRVEIDTRERQLARTIERLAQDREALAQDRDLLRSERLALLEMHKRLAPSAEATSGSGIVPTPAPNDVIEAPAATNTAGKHRKGWRRG